MSDCEHELGPPQLKNYKWGLCLIWCCKKCEHGWGTSKLDITITPNYTAMEVGQAVVTDEPEEHQSPWCENLNCPYKSIAKPGKAFCDPCMRDQDI